MFLQIVKSGVCVFRWPLTVVQNVIVEFAVPNWTKRFVVLRIPQPIRPDATSVIRNLGRTPFYFIVSRVQIVTVPRMVMTYAKHAHKSPYVTLIAKILHFGLYFFDDVFRKLSPSIRTVCVKNTLYKGVRGVLYPF